MISLRALDQSKTVYADGLMTQPFHPFTQASALPVPSDGSPVEVDVEIYPTGWVLPAGHTLRLTLQSADAPHLTASLSEGLNSAGATLIIYHDQNHDSELVIPVRGSSPAVAGGSKPAARHKSKPVKRRRPACRVVGRGRHKHRVCRPAHRRRSTQGHRHRR